MAPLTRCRALEDRIPGPLMKEYYSQRASVTGTFLITEATGISPKSPALAHTPGIYSDEQIAGWREITTAVHEKGSYIYLQLWHVGRAARPGTVVAGVEVVSASSVPETEESPVPRALTEEEILELIQTYKRAAINAMKAGFDGVEIHGANGYLIDQFTQDITNQRDDAWGGSIERRARFGLAIAKAVVDAVGADRVGYRISPFSRHHSMGMANPLPQFTYLVGELKKLRLAYLHIIEPRVSGNSDMPSLGSVEGLVLAWENVSPVLLAGGYTPLEARQTTDSRYRDRDVVIVFGRWFIANPDLPFRIKENVALNRYIRDLFYTVESPSGYTDYPFSDEFDQSFKI
ncbi:hypothetical protein AYO22_11727 [Fonsecaea multimorphosa]|nr:hypothetical protein AYO22_11727 [Fonsecaea multimorphosa]